MSTDDYKKGWDDAIARAVAVLSDAVARREPASTYVAMIKEMREMKQSRGNYSDIISDGGMDPRT